MKLRIITILPLIIGLSLFTYSLTLPYYKNQTTADNLIINSYDIEKTDYYKRESELRTYKLTFMDLGAGLAIASGTILLFFIFTKTKKLSDFKKLNTLNKSSLFIIANLAWLLLLPGTYWYYFFRGSRGDYPPFADSIGIPIMTQIPFFLFLIIPLNIFLFLTTINSNLPTRLFVKSETYDWQQILLEIFFSICILINIIICICFVIDGDHFSIPVNIFFTFILLTLRAGQISKYE